MQDIMRRSSDGGAAGRTGGVFSGRMFSPYLLRCRRHALLSVALTHPHLERVELDVRQHVAACVCLHAEQWRGASGEVALCAR